MDCSKASQDSDIPTKIIKDNIDIFVPVLLTEFNEISKYSMKTFYDSTFYDHSTFYGISKHNTSVWKEWPNCQNQL